MENGLNLEDNNRKNVDRINYCHDLMCLNCQDLCIIFNCNKQQIALWRELGILPAIRTGKGFVYTQKDVRDFQMRCSGYDISNADHVLENLQELLPAGKAKGIKYYER